MPYALLTKDAIPSYFIENDLAAKLLGTTDINAISVQEVSDGNMNFVFLVSFNECKVILKQAPPYLRVAGEDVPLAKERMHYEILALQRTSELAPDYVPDIYHTDKEMCVVIMEYLVDHIIMRNGMIAGTQYPEFAEHISSYLAGTLFNTSLLNLTEDEHQQLIKDFNDNPLRPITENYVFTFPFMQHTTNYPKAALSDVAQAIWQDQEFHAHVSALKSKFMHQHQALIHADLHTGSIMVGTKANSTAVIDYEFAYVGPFGFDLGALLGNLVMSWVSHFERSKNAEYQQHILAMIVEFYTKFENKFLALWNHRLLAENNLPANVDKETYQKEFMRNLLREMCGFAGCKIGRRQLGFVGVKDIRGIEDQAAATRAEKMALAIAREFVVHHQKINKIEDVIAILREFSIKHYPKDSSQHIMATLGINMLTLVETPQTIAANEAPLVVSTSAASTLLQKDDTDDNLRFATNRP